MWGGWWGKDKFGRAGVRDSQSVSDRLGKGGGEGRAGYVKVIVIAT